MPPPLLLRARMQGCATFLSAPCQQPHVLRHRLSQLRPAHPLRDPRAVIQAAGLSLSWSTWPDLVASIAANRICAIRFPVSRRNEFFPARFRPQRRRCAGPAAGVGFKPVRGFIHLPFAPPQTPQILT